MDDGDAPGLPAQDGLTRRGALVLGGSVVAALTVPRVLRPGAAAAQAGGIPRFEDVNGFGLGSRQASVAQLDDYVVRVAAASDRVTTAVLAEPTLAGRPIRYAVVSSPANLARLAEVERRTRALRLRPASAAEQARAAKELPALVHVYANVHGNEPSGADALAQLLYLVAAGEDAEARRRRDELVCIFTCVQNPDGREAGRRVNGSAFDLNRDWFALSQPETVGKVALLSRFPPVLAIDAHEQFLSAPDTFFFPPANDPAHHESSATGLKASDEVITPALEGAFRAKGYRWEHRGIYDVFYPGYGDIAPNHAWGAAGVLFEQENSDAYPNKVARQLTAMDAAVGAAAANKERLLAAWAAQWAPAAADGRAGRLLPNRIINPENPQGPAKVEDERVYGYALRTSRHAADAAHLVDRLRAFDVEVHVLRRTIRVARLRPFGARAFVPATLGRGTIVVLTAQPLKRWVHILLADDPFAALPYFYDVSGWSNPALMGLAGGAIGSPVAALLKRPRRTPAQIRARRRPRLATLRAVDRASELQAPLARGAAGYAFALDAALAQAAAFALAKDGVVLQRADGAVAGLPAGAVVVPAGARSALDAARKRYGIRPVPLAATPVGTRPLRRPRVALLNDPGSDASEALFASSRGFARWLLGRRFGLDLQLVTPAQVEAGALRSGVDALVVPDGLATVVPAGVPNVAFAPPGGGFTPAGLAEVQAFVVRGGTFAGWRTQGVAVARGAGIAGDLATVPAPMGFTVPGLPVAVELRSEDPAVRGLGGTAFVHNLADPILRGGGTTIARYPDRLNRLGYAEGLEAVNGTVAGTVSVVGKGRAYVLSFDPAYRAYVEGTQRIVGGILLAAGLPAGASARAAIEPLPGVARPPARRRGPGPPRGRPGRRGRRAGPPARRGAPPGAPGRGGLPRAPATTVGSSSARSTATRSRATPHPGSAPSSPASTRPPSARRSSRGDWEVPGTSQSRRRDRDPQQLLELDDGGGRVRVVDGRHAELPRGLEVAREVVDEDELLGGETHLAAPRSRRSPAWACARPSSPEMTSHVEELLEAATVVGVRAPGVREQPRPHALPP